MDAARRTAQRERAEALRALHEAPEPLVLVNVWDAASARTVAAAPGCRALATASWSIAAAYGYPDGEAIPLPRMIEAVERIAGATELPLTADLEGGYGDPGATVLRALEAGAVGCNLEDGTPDGLRPVEEHVAAVASAYGAGQVVDVPLVINARTDVYLRPDPVLDDAIARGVAYLEEGADCVFVPGVRDADAIRALASAFEGHLSVMAVAGAPSPAELAELGVARVSFGPGPLGVASAALSAAAAQLLAGGAYPDELGFRPPAG